VSELQTEIEINASAGTVWRVRKPSLRNHQTTRLARNNFPTPRVGGRARSCALLAGSSLGTGTIRRRTRFSDRTSRWRPRAIYPSRKIQRHTLTAALEEPRSRRTPRIRGHEPGYQGPVRVADGLTCWPNRPLPVSYLESVSAPFTRRNALASSNAYAAANTGLIARRTSKNRNERRMRSGPL
jgi:hypothetical protein